jgi:hypothetical protein
VLPRAGLRVLRPGAQARGDHATLAELQAPTRALGPIAGLIAFYNEKVDIVLDGERLERPITHFFK